MAERGPLAPRRIGAHAAIWLASAGLFALLPHRLARTLALDYEALFYNLVEGYPARVDAAAVAVGMRWIELGAAPLAVLLIGTLLYRVGGRHLPDSPLARPGWIPLAVVAAVAGVCWHLFALPASHGLAIWAQVEAYPWIQWAEKLPEITDRLRVEGPRYALAGLDGIGALFLLAVIALRGGEPGRPGGLGRWLSRGLFALVAVAALASSAPAGGVFALHGSRVGTAGGLGVFVDTCGQCHIRSRPLFFVKTPVEWRTTVDRMRTLEGAPLSDGQAERVVGFLCGMRSFSDRWTFRTRCQRCHRGGARGWEERTPEDWERVVGRMARWSPHYYRPQIRDQVVAHLTRTRSSEGATLGLSADEYRSFVALDGACSPCHSVSRNAEAVAAWTPYERQELLLRMGDKRPEPWSEPELRTLLEAYTALLDDPELRERLVPHDRPIGEGDLPW